MSVGFVNELSLLNDALDIVTASFQILYCNTQIIIIEPLKTFYVRQLNSVLIRTRLRRINTRVLSMHHRMDRSTDKCLNRLKRVFRMSTSFVHMVRSNSAC